MTRPVGKWVNAGSRYASSQHFNKATAGQKPFWTAGRVALFSAFTGSLAYLYGVNDSRAGIATPWTTKQTKQTTPKYASKQELEKVIVLAS